MPPLGLHKQGSCCSENNKLQSWLNTQFNALSLYSVRIFCNCFYGSALQWHHIAWRWQGDGETLQRAQALSVNHCTLTVS